MNINAEVKKDFECCPPFTPAKWDDKLMEWKDKHFIKDRVRTFFYMPLNFGQVMRRLDGKVRNAGADIPDWLCLADHTSKWNMDVYLAVDREIPGTASAKMTGRFYSKVYEGPFRETDKWCKDFVDTTKSKGLSMKKFLMWYTTCPKCAKKYGKNYVAIVSQVD